MNVVWTSSVPTIDGVIDDSWNAASPMSLSNLIVGSSPAAISAQVRVMWDETALYVLLEVEDSTPFEDDATIWRDDSFSVLFDGDNSKNDAATGYDANDAEVLMRRTTSDAGGANVYASNMTVATVERGGGYDAEIAVAWAAFPITPTADSQIGFDVKISNDVDGGNTTEEVITLFDSVGDSWGNPSSFGTLTLVAATTGRTWGGRALDPEGRVQTDWIGDLFVPEGYDSWVYSYEAEEWIWFPDPGNGGGWAFFLRL